MKKVTRLHVRAHPEDSTSCLLTLKLTDTLEAAQDAQRMRRVGGATKPHSDEC